jgi:nicotinamidase-related amidase
MQGIWVINFKSTLVNIHSDGGKPASKLNTKEKRMKKANAFSGSWLVKTMASVVMATTSIFAIAAPPPPKFLKASETAILLIDFQGNFVDPKGTWYNKFKPEFDKGMLDNVVKTVDEARSKGVWIIHVTEGYTQDYREVDETNPGGFHRGQLKRQAWKIGSPEAAYYPPLVPKTEYRDLVLAPRAQVSAFGGTGLNEILRAKGIKNVAIAGFTTDVCNYATTIAAYDLGYHVYALRQSMVGFYENVSNDLLNNIYPMWSVVVDNKPFLDMVQR